MKRVLCQIHIYTHPMWLSVCLGLCVMLLSGFRCGPIVRTCLQQADCTDAQICSQHRCLALAERSESPSEKRTELPVEGKEEGTDASEGLPEREQLRETPYIFEQPPEESPEPCEDGKHRACYTGPDWSRGKGSCQDGTQSCEDGRWGECLGEVRPANIRICGNNKDNDCDGSIDECDVGDWCIDGRPCKQGLTCHESMCLTTCDPSKGKENNPTCGGTESCFDRGNGQGVCKAHCFFGKTPCPPGQFCSKVPDYNDSLCVPTAPPQYGDRVAGQSCSLTDKQRFCDGTQQLVCVLDGQSQLRCTKGCRPDTAGCPTGTTCQADSDSFLGGVCR